MCRNFVIYSWNYAGYINVKNWYWFCSTSSLSCVIQELHLPRGLWMLILFRRKDGRFWLDSRDLWVNSMLPDVSIMWTHPFQTPWRKWSTVRRFWTELAIFWPKSTKANWTPSTKANWTPLKVFFFLCTQWLTQKRQGGGGKRKSNCHFPKIKWHSRALSKVLASQSAKTLPEEFSKAMNTELKWEQLCNKYLFIH